MCCRCLHPAVQELNTFKQILGFHFCQVCSVMSSACHGALQVGANV